MGLILHLVFIHVLIWIRFKHYVPGVVTSIIFLLPSIWLLFAAKKILDYDLSTILLACLVGMVLIVILIPALHKLMGPLSRALCKYSEIQEKE